MTAHWTDAVDFAQPPELSWRTNLAGLTIVAGIVLGCVWLSHHLPYAPDPRHPASPVADHFFDTRDS